MFRQMQYFVAVVETGSFTEAAERCYISQSAISQQISALEKELGVTLLKRAGRSFSLTATGEYFYRHSRLILSDVDALRREAARIDSDDDRRLRFGYLRHYAGQELQRAVGEFAALYPDVSVDIAIGTHEELYDLLRRGDVDMVISDQRRAFSDEYVNLHLINGECAAELSAHHPLGGSDALHTEQLERTACILVAGREQQKTEQEFYQNTLGIGAHFVFAETLEEARLMVIAGTGFLPVENTGGLAPLPPPIRRVVLYKGGRTIQRNFCAFWPKERGGRYIEAFAELLQNVFGS